MVFHKGTMSKITCMQTNISVKFEGPYGTTSFERLYIVIVAQVSNVALWAFCCLITSLLYVYFARGMCGIVTYT